MDEPFPEAGYYREENGNYLLVVSRAGKCKQHFHGVGYSYDRVKFVMITADHLEKCKPVVKEDVPADWLKWFAEVSV